MIDAELTRGDRQAAGTHHGEKGLQVVPVELVHGISVCDFLHMKCVIFGIYREKSQCYSFSAFTLRMLTDVRMQATNL
jgi:hypothetical protein